MGLGNSAHSYAPPLRRWNTRGWEDYRAAVLDGRSPEESRERVDQRAGKLEAIWLGLRSRSGIPMPRGVSKVRDTVDGWLERGLAVEEDGRLRLTAEGWLLLDELAVNLVDDDGRS